MRTTAEIVAEIKQRQAARQAARVAAPPESVAMQGVAAVATGSAPEEYLRRNIVIAKACGAKAEIKITTERLQQMKRVPKWLLASLAAMQVRVEHLPEELARWRDASPDNPYSRNNQDVRRGP